MRGPTVNESGSESPQCGGAIGKPVGRSHNPLESTPEKLALNHHRRGPDSRKVERQQRPKDFARTNQKAHAPTALGFAVRIQPDAR